MYTGKSHQTAWAGAAVAGLLMLTAGAASEELRFTPLALSGQTAPGTSDSFLIANYVFIASMLHDGQVALSASLNSPAGTDKGLWIGPPQGLALRFRLGQPAPGVAEANFSSLSSALANSAGQFMVMASVNDPSATSGVWSSDNGTLGLVARSGVSSPELPADTRYKSMSFRPYGLSDQGQVLFAAGLTASPSVEGDEAIFVGRPGELSMVARTGQYAPGAGRWFATGQTFVPVMNRGGQVAFAAWLDYPFSPNQGIWLRQPSGQVAPVMLTGQEAPGTEGRSFRFAPGWSTLASLNDAGQIAFHVGLTGPNPKESGVFVGLPGDLHPVATTGQTAPGAAPGLSFESFRPPKLTGSGLVAFAAQLQGSGLNRLNNEGIWAHDGRRLRPVLLEGQSLPGLPEGVMVGQDSDALGVLGNFIPNANGWIVGHTWVAGDSVTAANDRILFAINALTGQRFLLAREGDPFSLAPDDQRIVSEINLVTAGGYAANTVRPVAFNDRDELVFRLQFTDGSSGVFYTVVPEPTLLPLAALLMPVLLRRRRFGVGTAV